MAYNLEITLDTIAKEIGISASTLDQEIAKMAHLVQRIGLSTFLCDSLSFVLDFFNKIHNAGINDNISSQSTKSKQNKTGGGTFSDDYYQY